MGEKRAWTIVVGLIAPLLGTAALAWTVGDVGAATEGVPTSSTEPVDQTSSTEPVEMSTTVPVPATTEPAEVSTTVPLPATTEPVEVSTTVPVPSTTEPVETVATTTTVPVVPTTTATCEPFVDGDGPISLTPGCEFAPPPSAASNPSVGPACGLTVMLVVDRSASMSAAGGSVQAVLSTLLDALRDTGSTVALVDFADGAAALIDYTSLDGEPGAFEGYVADYGPGGATDLGAGLAAAANVGSPDLTVVITDGVTNASSGLESNAPAGQLTHPLSAAVERANHIKAGGSRIFVVGLGDIDGGAVSAISGPGSGTDIAVSDYTTVADIGSLGASLEVLATGGCPGLEAPSEQPTEVPVESAAPVTTPPPVTETVQAATPPIEQTTSEQPTQLAATAAATVSGAPRITSVTPGNRSATIRFTAPSSTGGSPIRYYLVQRSTRPTSGFFNFAKVWTGSVTSGGLTNGTRYYFRVIAVNAVGMGAPSNVVSAVAGVPSTPRITSVTPGNRSATIRFIAPSITGGSPIRYYLVQRSTRPTSGFFNFAKVWTGSVTSGGLTNGTRYYFRVIAVNARGMGAPSNVVSAVAGVPSTPRITSVTPGSRSATIRFTAPSSTGGSPIRYYLVQRSTRPTSGFFNFAKVWTGSVTSGGLTNGTRYYFRVIAVNARGMGAPSNVVSAVPTASATGSCTSSTPHVPGGPNGRGGCWPSPSTVGVPAGTSLTAYTGPCTISTPNTVITEKRVNCNPLRIETTGVRVVRSLVNGAISVGSQGTDPEGDDPIRVTILNSEIDASSTSGNFRPVSSSHFYVSGSYLHGTYSGAECHNACTIVNSYVQGFGSHASGMRVLRNATVTGSVIWCQPNPNSDDDNDGVSDVDGGCSADMTMYEEFGTPANNRIERNLFMATWAWFCARQDGGNAGGIRFIDNVFQRGQFGTCGRGAPMEDFESAGNTYTGNRYDNGSPVAP